MEVFADVRAQYSGDSTVMPIVTEGENICMAYSYTRP